MDAPSRRDDLSLSLSSGDADHLVDVCRRFVAAVERDDVGTKAELLDPSCIQEELPNRFAPRGGNHDLAAMAAAAERGRKVLASQRYVIRKALVVPPEVVLQIEWSGVLAVPVPAVNLEAGATLRAHIAMFFELRGGRIVRIRNYDCYEPF